MPITISVPDVLRQSVEATSGGKNTVLYDDQGNPSIMVVVPRFFLSDLDSALATDPHPAFKWGERDLNYIYIGKFESTWAGDRPVSMPGVRIVSSTKTFDDCLTATRSKGPGWHIMTQAEYAAIALWCVKNGFLPKGNTASTAAFGATYQRGVPSGDTGLVWTGSGPQSWYHSNTPLGISDLVGNATEWVSGMQIHNAELQLVPYNNAAGSNVDLTPTSDLWKAIDYATGGWISPGSANSIKITRDTNYYPVWDFSTPAYLNTFTYTNFSYFSIGSGVSAAAVTTLRQYGLYPVTWGSYGLNRWSYVTLQDGIYRIPRRTAYCPYETGMFTMDITQPRTYNTQSFRLAHFIQ